MKRWTPARLTALAVEQRLDGEQIEELIFEGTTGDGPRRLIYSLRTSLGFTLTNSSFSGYLEPTEFCRLLNQVKARPYEEED